VKEEVELMSKLVGELLDYSKAGLDAPRVELESVSVFGTIQPIVEREAANHSVEIDIDIDENTRVLARPELFSRAFGNVFRNAVKYAGEFGKITVTAKTEGPNVWITVADNGNGVAHADLERIFDPLYRIDSHRSRQSGGSGLGLAIVKTCIEACGGRVF